MTFFMTKTGHTLEGHWHITTQLVGEYKGFLKSTQNYGHFGAQKVVKNASKNGQKPQFFKCSVVIYI